MPYKNKEDYNRYMRERYAKLKKNPKPYSNLVKTVIKPKPKPNPKPNTLWLTWNELQKLANILNRKGQIPREDKQWIWNRMQQFYHP